MNNQETPKTNPSVAQIKSFSTAKEEAFSKLDIYIPEWLEYKVSGKECISWGSDNMMPKYLITMRDSYAIHNAILTKKELYTNQNRLFFSSNFRDLVVNTYSCPTTISKT